MLTKIVSGGQTGVDRAALDSALELGFPCGGWCPKGRKAKDGPPAVRYPLTETPTGNCAERTKWNVRDSDGTLLLTRSANGSTAIRSRFSTSPDRGKAGLRGSTTKRRCSFARFLRSWARMALEVRRQCRCQFA